LKKTQAQRFDTALRPSFRESNAKKVELLRKKFLSNSLVKLWLGNLRPKFDKKVMHSGKSGVFENAMGKLFEFELRRGKKVFYFG